MNTSKIMLIRHGEKPTTAANGIDANGTANAEDLIVRGWQRGGALARFFVPIGGNFSQAGITTPTSIYASGVAHHSESFRPQHTVLETATLLNLATDTQFEKGVETDLAAAVQMVGGTVLIAWEHENIPAIVNAIVGNTSTCPQSWPGDRFDVVWILDANGTVGWTFSQTPQLVLSGDSDSVISF